MNRVVGYSLLILVFISAAAAISGTKRQGYLSEHAVQQFKKDAREFSRATLRMKDAIDSLSETDTLTFGAARTALVNARLAYKQIEFFMEYFFTYPVNLYNRAPVYEIEEPYMEYQAPVGLQVIEDLLLDDQPFLHKKELKEQIAGVHSTAMDIPAIMYGFKVDDEQIAAAIRLELVRVITLGITGYDAPKLKTGIVESAKALSAVKEVLGSVISNGESESGDSVLWYLDRCIELLNVPVSFDDFDRMAFLIKAALPLQMHFNHFIVAQNIFVADGSILSPGAKHLFQPDVFKMDSFLRQAGDTSTAMVSLGKQLFFEQGLSGNGKRSCASCHHPDKLFTDGLPQSIAFNGKDKVQRNAPSLLYVALQHGQFLDARSPALEDQVLTVLQNPVEMNADLKKITRRINNKAYRNLFKQAFPGGKKDTVISATKIARAIAAYERTLMPFNAPFDRYINGDEKAMNASQIKGFNLFMGKAQCGTCHFAPVFNGLLPPLYTVTELEVLGVPQNGSLTHPTVDKDMGRFGFFNIAFYKGAFKTPTVRNSSKTAPYMHNGSFKTMEDVIVFYNKGGGVGIGLDVSTQTLSSRPLQLSGKEVKDLVHFMEALNDDILY